MRNKPNKPTVVEVTEYHIKHGTQHSSENCPVALALQSTFQTKAACMLYGYEVAGKWYDLAEEVTDKIVEFDLCRRMEPFTFEVDHG